MSDRGAKGCDAARSTSGVVPAVAGAAGRGGAARSASRRGAALVRGRQRASAGEASVVLAAADTVTVAGWRWVAR